MIEKLKQLRMTLLASHDAINEDWGDLDIDSESYLSEHLAALTIEIKENIDMVNQMIGELV